MFHQYGNIDILYLICTCLKRSLFYSLHCFFMSFCCCCSIVVYCIVFIFPFLPIHLLFLIHIVLYVIPFSLHFPAVSFIFSTASFLHLLHLLPSSSALPFLVSLISSHVPRLCLMFYSSAILEFPLSIFVTLPLLCCLVSSLFVSNFCLISPLFLFLRYITSCSHSPLPFPSLSLPLYTLIWIPSRDATLNHKR